MGHLTATTNTECDKYLLLYTFLKLQILNGKTLIMAKNLEQAYKIRIFLMKFQMRSFVVNPDSTKSNQRSVVHFFNIGQFDILIMVRGANYEKDFKLGEVLNVVNFDIPR